MLHVRLSAAVAIVVAAFFSGCGEAGNSAKRSVLDFVECDSIALSDLLRCDSTRSVAFEDTDSLWVTNPPILRINDRYMASCQPFGPHRGVWLYAADGRYLGEVGRIGRGPDEYLFPMDILFDPTGDTLFVEDKGRKEMLAYTLSDRRMRNSYKFPFHSKCVAIDSRSGDFVWYVSSSNSNRETYETVVRTTRDGKVVAQGSPVEQLDSYSGMWQTLTLFHDTPEGMMAHHQFQPELFVVSDGSRQVMTLRFEYHSFAPESFDWSRKGFRERISTSPYVQYYDVFQTSGLLYVRFCAGGKTYAGVYDKVRKQGCYCAEESIADDLGIGCVPRVKGVWDDRFYCTVTPEFSDCCMAPAVVWFE